MPVAGLTLTFNQNMDLATQAVGELHKHPSVELGDMNGRYIAAVMDTENSRESRDLHRWIESLPGIDFVDVVYVGFDEEASSPATPLS